MKSIYHHHNNNFSCPSCQSECDRNGSKMTRSKDGRFLRSMSMPERERERGSPDREIRCLSSMEHLTKGILRKESTRGHSEMFFMYSRRQAMYSFSGGWLVVYLVAFICVTGLGSAYPPQTHITSTVLKGKRKTDFGSESIGTNLRASLSCRLLSL